MSYASKLGVPAFVAVLLGVASAGLCLSCSGGKDDDANGAAGGSGPGPIRLTSGGSMSQGQSGSGNGDPACSTTDPLLGCAGVSFESESIPLDIYILFDQSGSMLNDVGGLTRMDAVQQAVASFLHDPESRGLGVGIGYFGYQPIGQVVCDAKEYTPDVPVTSDHEAVLASLNARMPTGETPTSAALAGACRYAASYKMQNRSRNLVILLVTDGKPEAPVSCNSGGCCPTLDEATATAAECLTKAPNVSTYVLGVGPNLDNLHAIARAGGTKNAYLVGDQDVSSRVLEALNAIRRDAQIPCSLEIPAPTPGEVIDYDQVNVTASRAGCASTIYRVPSAAQCSPEGGWHYDDAAAPTHIELCPSSCDLVNNASVALKVLVGCASVEPPVR